ncbi:hypothetical protein CHRYSEOSP005_02660 [Chryseobacterium sp. Alg-005]|uniref:zincin-like metallopeptidase toxin domain-containing protein n=1 Tax=Chryseobacterium sp. Alg-005 TaxID=3159516 RepID=UPI00355592F2
MSLEILNNPLLETHLNSLLGSNNPNLSGSSFSVLKSPVEFKQLTSKQIADTYYNGKPVTEGKGFQIYSDDPVFGGNIEEVTLYKTRFNQTIGGIDVVLFASRDGAFLLQRFMEALPQSNELILFMEIDDKYNRNTVLRAVAGTNLTHKKDIPFADILNFTRKHEVTVTPEALKKLIEEKIYRNKVGFISWFLGLKDASVGRIFSFFKQDLLEKAGAFFEETIADNIAGLKITENGWNPTPKKGEYSPAFIPDALHRELKKYYEHKASPNPYENLDGQKKISSGIVRTLFAKISDVKSDFKNLLNNADPFFPDFIYRKLKQALNLFFGKIDKMEEYLADPLTGLQHVIYRGHQVANALLCGIYNSLIDIIAGIFSLIGFIFKAVATMEKIKDRKVEYGEMFLELMEDMMEGIMKFDYADFFYRCITFQMRTVLRLVKWIDEAMPGFTLEKAAYYYGYVIGMIADIIVETLLTGGAAVVAKLAKTVESFLLKPLEKIAQIVSKAENLLTRVLDFIGMMLREFKKGPKEIFSKLEKFLNEAFGFGENVADHALTPAEKRWKDKQRKIQEKLERKNKKYSPENIKGNGVYNGKILSKYDIEEWGKLLKKKFGTSLKKVERFKDPSVLAQFDPNTNTILYKQNVTEYLMAHEHFHAEEMYKIGFDEYVKDAPLSHIMEENYTPENWKRLYKREKYVYDQLVKNAKKFYLNNEELQHAFFYFDGRVIFELEKRNIKIPKI